MLQRFASAVLMSLLLSTPVLAQAPAITGGANPRPPGSASSTALTLEGIPNFHKVATNFYRSGQPSEGGFERLVNQYHIRTVISLRTQGRDEPLTIGLPLDRQRFPIRAWAIADERANVVAALRALRIATRKGPTLLHCEHGSDRTGLVTALYRILYDNWSKEQALREMQDKEFGFNPLWQNIVRFVENENIARLRHDVGTP